MKERPILFSGPMVRAILEGRKSQTRRLVKLPSDIVSLYRPFPNEPQNVQGVDKDGLIGWYAAPSACPYGVPGDRLWVRETWAVDAPLEQARREHEDALSSFSFGHGPYFRAEPVHENAGLKWRPSIFMPRWACRLVLEVTAVRVERLQELSQEDAEAEGVKCDLSARTFRDHYRVLWDSLNAKRAPWEGNPWVWVVEFKRTETSREQG